MSGLIYLILATRTTLVANTVIMYADIILVFMTWSSFADVYVCVFMTILLYIIHVYYVCYGRQTCSSQ